jgi:hypothetical protein
VFEKKNLLQNKNLQNKNIVTSPSKQNKISKYQQKKLINLRVGGYRIPSPNTLEITVSASGGPNQGRLTPEEERKTEVLVYIPLPKEVKNFHGNAPTFSNFYETKRFLLSSPQIRKRYLKGSTIYTITLTNIVSGGEFKVKIDPLNRIPEKNENDNEKTFKISSGSLSPSSFSQVNLWVQGYRIVASRTLEIIVGSRKLPADEERRTQVKITFPDGSQKSYSLGARGIRKERKGLNINYIIRLSNVTSAGNFTVEVDPLNLIAEWDENDNVKTFNISLEDLERRWEAELNLVPDISVRGSHTVIFEVTNRGRKLTSEEERNCKVRIAYPPNNSQIGNLTQFRKEVRREATFYLLEISDIFEGGTFEIEVDTDDVIFEQNEDDNIKTVKISRKQLSDLIIISPSSPLTVISGSSLNVEWRYSPPRGIINNNSFCIEVLNTEIKICDDFLNTFYQLQMPLDLGIYKIKVSNRDSYDISPPIRVVAATPPPNPGGFRLTSPLPRIIQNGSIVDVSYEADTNLFSRIREVEIVAPDLHTVMGRKIIRNVLDSSGTFSVQVELHSGWFGSNNKADAFLRFLLQRRRMDQIDSYVTNLITINK